MSGKHRNMDHLDILYASWTDALQEFISTHVGNFRLTRLNDTTIRAEASTGDDSCSLAIGGMWRYRTTPYDVAITGATGIKDLYVVAVTANDFVGAGDDPDETDYNWDLRMVTVGGTPAGVAAYRKAGEVDWDNSLVAITGLRQTLGQITQAMMSPQSRVPAGGMMEYGGAAAPPGYLFCDGSAVNRKTYGELFKVIGTTYGVGNGTTTFNLPDFRGRVSVSADSMPVVGSANRLLAYPDTLGGSSGEEKHPLLHSESGVPAHGHSVSDPGHAHNVVNNVSNTLWYTGQGLGGGLQGVMTLNGGGSQMFALLGTTGISVVANSPANAAASHNNMQPYLIANKIIKI